MTLDEQYAFTRTAGLHFQTTQSFITNAKILLQNVNLLLLELNRDINNDNNKDNNKKKKNKKIINNINVKNKNLNENKGKIENQNYLSFDDIDEILSSTKVNLCRLILTWTSHNNLMRKNDVKFNSLLPKHEVLIYAPEREELDKWEEVNEEVRDNKLLKNEGKEKGMMRSGLEEDEEKLGGKNDRGEDTIEGRKYASRRQLRSQENEKYGRGIVSTAEGVLSRLVRPYVPLQLNYTKKSENSENSDDTQNIVPEKREKREKREKIEISIPWKYSSLGKYGGHTVRVVLQILCAFFHTIFIYLFIFLYTYLFFIFFLYFLLHFFVFSIFFTFLGKTSYISRLSTHRVFQDESELIQEILNTITRRYFPIYLFIFLTIFN